MTEHEKILLKLSTDYEIVKLSVAGQILSSYLECMGTSTGYKPGGQEWQAILVAIEYIKNHLK